MNSPFAIQSFADLLSLHAAEQVSNESSDDDASRDHAVVDFVDSMVQAIVINRASGTSLALPAVRASKQEHEDHTTSQTRRGESMGLEQ